MAALRSWMEMFDELKAEMPEGTYLKLCDKAKREFETSKAQKELYEVTYLCPRANVEDDDGMQYDDTLGLYSKTSFCMVKNATKYLAIIEKEGSCHVTDDFTINQTRKFRDSHIDPVILFKDYEETTSGVYEPKKNFTVKLSSVIITKMTQVGY